VPDESAANDALTREIEQLRDVLAHAQGRLGARTGRAGDDARWPPPLKHSLRELDATQRELFARLGGNDAA